MNKRITISIDENLVKKILKYQIRESKKRKKIVNFSMAVTELCIRELKCSK